MVYRTRMRRIAPTLPVTPTMLRHFVAITVMATAGLAMFANGENTGAIIEAQKAARQNGGGAWSKTPRNSNPTKQPATVNGMKLAPGTRLQNNSGDDYEIGRSGEGNIRYLSPEYNSLDPVSPAAGAAGGGGQAIALAAPAPIQRDAKGIPLPPGSALQGQPPGASRPPPRKPTAEEVHRMMEASRLRGLGNNAGESANSDY